MIAYDLSLGHNPLVVLNGCGTGNINPLYVSNLVGMFIECGARGVIATECDIPDQMAAKFSEQLYTYLIEGKELGTSLTLTRNDLVKTYNSPFPLVYALYSSPNYRFSKE